VISGGRCPSPGLAAFAANHLDADQQPQARQIALGLQSSLPSDKAFLNSSNTASLILGLINSTQGTVQNASTAYTTGAQQIGSSPDVKGSIDQNSQIQAQNGQSIVQLNGAVNTAAAAANQANLDRIAALSAAARAMQFKPYGQ